MIPIISPQLLLFLLKRQKATLHSIARKLGVVDLFKLNEESLKFGVLQVMLM